MLNAKPLRLFVYNNFLPGRPDNALFNATEPLLIARGCVPDYQFYLIGEATVTAVNRPGANLTGCLYAVKPASMAMADSHYWNRMCRRVCVKVHYRAPLNYPEVEVAWLHVFAQQLLTNDKPLKDIYALDEKYKIRGASVYGGY